jgi:magnesium-transporting ATPase (P-type)
VGVLWRAAILAAATIAVMVYAEYVDGAGWSRVQTMVFTTLVLVQLAYAFLIRAEDRTRPLRGIGYLVVATAASLVLQLAVVYVPAGQELFSVVPLRPQDWVVVVVATAAAMSVVGLAHRLRLAVERI